MRTIWKYQLRLQDAPAPEDQQATYIGSAICAPFVWHVFDGGEVE